VEVPVDRIVEKIVYVNTDVPVVQVSERLVEVPVNHISEKLVHVPCERVVEIEVPFEVPVEVEVEVPVDRIVEVPVEVPVNRYIREEVQVPVERIVNNYLEVPYYVDRTVAVPHVIEKTVEIVPEVHLQEVHHVVDDGWAVDGHRITLEEQKYNMHRFRGASTYKADPHISMGGVPEWQQQRMANTRRVVMHQVDQDVVTAIDSRLVSSKLAI
jgi:hypothetical protein